jgi:hypothetical protein
MVEARSVVLMEVLFRPRYILKCLLQGKTLNSTVVRALGALAVAAIFLSGCDTSSALFSEDEKSSIYTLSFSDGDAKLAGAEVKAGDSIAVSVASMHGAAEAGSLSLSLESADGGSLAALNYVTGASKAASGAKELAVDKIVGSLPSFPLPASLVPGSYRLVAQLLSASGAVLAKSETVFFAAEESFGLDALSLYPPTPAPGEAILLSAAAHGGAVSQKTAWVRWSLAGKTFAEGLLSAGYDKVVWRSPRLEGAYALSAELYPSKPPEVTALPASPWTRGITALVAASAAAASDEYADSSRFVSHFAFEGDFSDSGTRSQGEKPQSFGVSALETYPGGFGYRFDGSSGLSAPGALPASSNFTLLARLYSEGEGGDIVRLASADGSSILRLGLQGRVPFAETRTAEGLVSRSSPPVEVPAGLLNLALSFSPRGDRYELVWSIGGERYSSASLPRISFPEGAKCVLGGAQALEGVYDEIAISDDTQSGPPPLYAAASLRKYGSDLYIASGFEATSLPPDAVASGGVSFERRSLALGPGARLSFTGALPTTRALRLELDFAAEKDGNLVLELSPKPYAADGAKGGTEAHAIIVVDSNGAIRGGDGQLLGLLSPEEKGKLVFTLKANKNGFELASASGLSVAQIAAPASSSRLFLSLSNRGGSGSVSLRRLLARAAPEFLSLADSPRYARLQ